MGLSSPSTPSSFLGEAGINTGLNMTQHDSTINSSWPKLEPKLPLPCVDATSHAHDVAAVCTQLNQIPTAVVRRFLGFPGTDFDPRNVSLPRSLRNVPTSRHVATVHIALDAGILSHKLQVQGLKLKLILKAQHDG
jgi:hypothetical protein